MFSIIITFVIRNIIFANLNIIMDYLLLIIYLEFFILQVNII